MDFEEHEDQDEELGMQLPPANYDSMMRPRIGGAGEGVSMVGASTGARKPGGFRYKECLKNHAVGIGGSAVDGCGEFMAAGEDGTLDALKCAACHCHRNFHRKESDRDTALATLTIPQHHQLNPYRPAGYLHVTPMSQQRPLALPSNSRELEMDEDMSNPSSSGGGGGGGGGGGSSSRKRFRTKFTADQKERMLELAERLGWRIQKHDEALVQNFCAETGLKRHVLKVWMHNNKHTLGKKLP